MSRLTPLIARAPRSLGPARAWTSGAVEDAATAIKGDFRLFLTAFLGGLVFFGTLFA